GRKPRKSPKHPNFSGIRCVDASPPLPESKRRLSGHPLFRMFNMRFFRESCRFLCIPLAVLIMLISAPWTTVSAALVTTDQVISRSDTVSADREKIAHFLQQDAVRKQLTAMGVQPAEVEARVAALSPN